MNTENQYFFKGILFTIIGIIFLLGGVRIFTPFVMLMYILSAVLIYKGYRMIKYKTDPFTGKVLIGLGAFIILIYSKLPLALILSLICLCVGFYFIFIKSRVFIRDRGIFKDSRDSVFIRENLSNVKVNVISQNLKSLDTKMTLSKVDLDLSYAYIQGNTTVNFHVNAYLSEVKIITGSYCNVLLNGKYIRKIDGSEKTINITCKNFLSIIDIM